MTGGAQSGRGGTEPSGLAHSTGRLRVRRRLPWEALAAGSLVVVLVWRAMLLWMAPPSLVPRLVMPPPSGAGDSVRYVLVVDDDEPIPAPGRFAAVPADRPVEVYGVPWTTRISRRSAPARVAALVRSYGHTQLPVLLTISGEGWVVRAQPVSRAAPLTPSAPSE